MCDSEKLVKIFLNKCGIVFDDWNHLDGMHIPRDILLSESVYETVKEDIEKLKKLYSSGSLTSLQKNAKSSQKWPLLNLVRQILKSNNYIMNPKRKSNGYTAEGKKKYIRSFIIKKVKSTQNIDENKVDENKLDENNENKVDENNVNEIISIEKEVLESNIKKDDLQKQETSMFIHETNENKDVESENVKHVKIINNLQ